MSRPAGPGAVGESAANTVRDGSRAQSAQPSLGLRGKRASGPVTPSNPERRRRGPMRPKPKPESNPFAEDSTKSPANSTASVRLTASKPKQDLGFQFVPSSKCGVISFGVAIGFVRQRLTAAQRDDVKERRFTLRGAQVHVGDERGVSTMPCLRAHLSICGCEKLPERMRF